MTTKESKDLDAAAPVDLAHAAPFRLGAAQVSPATRTIQFPDGEAILEPRVMQALVALARAEGAVVSRDDLVASCWEGRAISEDAINRVISKLRRLSERDGGGAFKIETIARVGYRLKAGCAAPTAAATAQTLEATRAPDRRRLLIFGGAALAACGAAAAGLMLWPRSRPHSEAQLLIDQGLAAIRLNLPDQTAQAVAYLREATTLAPDNADAWSALGYAYISNLRFTPREEQAAMRQNALAAFERALTIAPDHIEAHLGLVLERNPYGRWAFAESVLRDALRRAPDHLGATRVLFSLLNAVGRLRAAAPVGERSVARDPMAPYPRMHLAMTYWGIGRVEESLRMIDGAATRWPGHFGVWFTRFWLLTYNGQAARAEAIARDRSGWPADIPDWNFEACADTARAFATGDPADRTRALEINRDLATRGAGFAQNAISVHASLGALDGAFEVADAYFFGRGFQVGPYLFSAQQGAMLQDDLRLTHFLFMPATAAMRRDRRFEALVEEIGLAAYWRDMRVAPDYRVVR
ncbi:MAG: winged helix-turn-helix domain-containing protein [Hyphomonadaceae bacterium]|nr:winged helix-turn-helix domain-containing protein [Hyphomonadaceae bacterium]